MLLLFPGLVWSQQWVQSLAAVCLPPAMAAGRKPTGAAGGDGGWKCVGLYVHGDSGLGLLQCCVCPASSTAGMRCAGGAAVE